MRALRRRILKKDGRVLEPERTPRASQEHADLSQLEQGDLVEAIYEGWALPGDTGQIGIDTPDLLPERVAVNEATVELRLPSALGGSLWSHPLLGDPQKKAEGGTRVLEWHVADLPVRRVEDGVPQMDRSASISFSTAQWSDFGRALRRPSRRSTTTTRRSPSGRAAPSISRRARAGSARSSAPSSTPRERPCARPTPEP